MYPLLLALVLLPGATKLDHGPEPKGASEMWVTSEDYPNAALNAGVEGVSAVELGIDTLGRVASCIVTSGSGSRLLDGMACGLLTARGSFYPATDVRGHPVSGTYARRVRWLLPHDVAAEPVEFRPFNVMASFDITEQGRVENCQLIVATKIDGMGNPCDGFTRGRFDPPRDGKGVPVRRTIYYRMSMQPK